jgi:hypothetical protein
VVGYGIVTILSFFTERTLFLPAPFVFSSLSDLASGTGGTKLTCDNFDSGATAAVPVGVEGAAAVESEDSVSSSAETAALDFGRPVLPFLPFVVAPALLCFAFLTAGAVVAEEESSLLVADCNDDRDEDDSGSLPAAAAVGALRFVLRLNPVDGAYQCSTVHAKDQL